MSEPLMTCRKLVGRHRNQACEADLGPSSEDTLLTVRAVAGMETVSPAQARVRNVGTFRLDAKGEIQVEEP